MLRQVSESSTPTSLSPAGQFSNILLKIKKLNKPGQGCSSVVEHLAFIK